MSTATMVDDASVGRHREQTCVHPPGAAQRSSTVLAFCNIENFRLICVNLKAARDRYPCSFATAHVQEKDEYEERKNNNDDDDDDDGGGT
jgi:hypothetical protein